MRSACTPGCCGLLKSWRRATGHKPSMLWFPAFCSTYAEATLLGIEDSMHRECNRAKGCCLVFLRVRWAVFEAAYQPDGCLAVVEVRLYQLVVEYRFSICRTKTCMYKVVIKNQLRCRGMIRGF